MRFLVLAASLLFLFVSMLTLPAATSAAECGFILGFKTLHDLIPRIVGECLVDEHFNPESGNALQETTGTRADGGYGGLLVWRKADNYTAFTDGYRTWIHGPEGLQQRLNGERFAWEPDRLLPALRNAEYRLPVFGNEEATFRLSGGEVEFREQRARVKLIEEMTAFGDLNGDGVPDAVVLLAADTGGSGTFEYALALLDRSGVPEQVGQEFLGDRVRVNGITISNRQITVDMISHGPRDPLCCPTQRVDKTLAIQIP